jgi:hypothetical protein
MESSEGFSLEQSKSTTSTEASNTFLERWSNKIPPKYKPLAYLPLAAWLGTQVAMENYKGALAQGAFAAVLLGGAKLANRYYERTETQRQQEEGMQTTSRSDQGEPYQPVAGYKPDNPRPIRLDPVEVPRQNQEGETNKN